MYTGGYDSGYIRIWSFDTDSISHKNDDNYKDMDIDKLAGDVYDVDIDNDINIDNSDQIVNNSNNEENISILKDKSSIFNFHGCNESEIFFMSCHDFDSTSGGKEYVPYSKKWVKGSDNINPVRFNNNYEMPLIDYSKVDDNDDGVDIDNNININDDINSDNNDSNDSNNDNKSDDNEDNHNEVTDYESKAKLNDDTKNQNANDKKNNDIDNDTDSEIENTDVYPLELTAGRAPLILLSQWQGHHSAILSIQYIFFDRDNAPEEKGDGTDGETGISSGMNIRTYRDVYKNVHMYNYTYIYMHIYVHFFIKMCKLINM